MPVVAVGKVGMAVPQRQMRMRMRVGLFPIPGKGVIVTVVHVMAVRQWALPCFNISTIIEI